VNKQTKSLFYLNACYWLLLGIFEGVGFFPGMTLKAGKARGLPEWDTSVLLQYWQYLLTNSIPKYIVLWVLGFGIMLIFFQLKNLSRTKLLIGLIVGSFIHSLLQSLFSQWFGISMSMSLFQLINAKVNLLVVFVAILSTSISYWLFVVALLAFDYFQRYKEERIINLELSNSVSKAKLESLVYQLRPHFLFNAMNAISMLVRANRNEKAVEVISDLSDLLRSSLKDEKRNIVPLKEEIELAKKYLELEEKLYSEHLTASIEISEKASKVLVPYLLLQPIIENAFKHGLSKITSKGYLNIKGEVLENERLEVTITNSGPGLNEDWSLENNYGVGLSNVVSRLKNLYADSYLFSIRNSASNEVTVTINLPIKK
jgi:two-component system, LytTR family, sensor kinase